MSEIFATAISGMNAAVKRMTNAATNIVNASSTGKLPDAENPDATSYMPTDVVSVSLSVGDNHFGVDTKSIARTPSYHVMRDETSPFANKEGLVAAPNVDISSEMIASKMAEIAYKASASVIKVEREVEKTAIEMLS